MNTLNKIKILTKCVFGDKRSAFEARYMILSFLAKKISVRLYNKDLIWPEDEEFKSVWGGYPARGNTGVHERRFNLYYLSKSIKDLEGDTAECGVFEGASSYLILKSNSGTGKEHYIFDSFEGLSKIEENDFVINKKIPQWKESDLSVGENVVRHNLDEFENVHYLKGWIPERFGEISNKKYSFAHIDVDLYQPTLESINYFYNRMVVGGMIVCDDYGFNTCPGAYKAMKEFFSDKTESIIHLTTGQGVVIKH